MYHQTAAAGEVIFLQGQEGRNAYRIVSGRVQIYLTRGEADIVLGEAGPGEVIGEMALIQDRPRSASARAIDPTELEVLTEYDFTQMFLSHPDRMLPFLASFFERLRHANELIAANAQTAPPPPHAVQHDRVPHLRMRPEDASSPEGTMPIPKFPFRIGRAGPAGGYDVLFPNDLCVDDAEPFEISRNQCVIERFGSIVSIRDRGSKRGTIVNGERIGSHVSSKISADLHLGDNTVVFGSDASRHRYVITVE